MTLPYRETRVLNNIPFRASETRGRDILFLMREFPEVSSYVIRSASASLRHTSAQLRPCTMRFLTCHPPRFPRLYSGCSCIRVICNTRGSHAGDFETLTMGKAPLNGRHARRRAGQSLDYSAADFSRCFSLGRGCCHCSLPARQCNFSGVNRTM